MTCIVGFAQGGKTWIGGDACISGWNRFGKLSEGKVFMSNGILHGLAGSPREMQLLKYSLSIQEQAKSQTDDHKYLVNVYADAVRKLFKDNGSSEIVHSKEWSNSHWMIGYRGKIYMVYSDYQIEEFGCKYSALGSGNEYALGSLRTSEVTCKKEKPEYRLAMAMASAAEFCPSVCGPFHVKCVDKNGKESGEWKYSHDLWPIYDRKKS